MSTEIDTTDLYMSVADAKRNREEMSEAIVTYLQSKGDAGACFLLRMMQADGGTFYKLVMQGKRGNYGQRDEAKDAFMRNIWDVTVDKDKHFTRNVNKAIDKHLKAVEEKKETLIVAGMSGKNIREYRDVFATQDKELEEARAATAEEDDAAYAGWRTETKKPNPKSRKGA